MQVLIFLWLNFFVIQKLDTIINRKSVFLGIFAEALLADGKREVQGRTGSIA